MRLQTQRSPQNSSRSLRRGVAVAAVPTALAVGLSLLPNATAQSSLGGLSSRGGFSDNYAPSAPPQRTPIETEQSPEIAGLPEGVKVNRIEYLTPRHVKVWIKSAVMPDREIGVQILLARDWYSHPDAKFGELWALDGLRARDDESGWTIETNIIEQFSDKNVNVVMPIGGEASFYTDWQTPDNGKTYQWESFFANELVPILHNKFRSNGNRAVVGISMGGTAAMNLAERRPHLFKFVGSFSGYLDMTSVGMPQAVQAAQQDAGGYNTTAMWGEPGSQDWIDHDPKLGVAALKGKTVYVSSGSGKDDFGLENSIAKGPANAAGVGLEVISRMSTQTFVDYAIRAGVEPIVRFRPSGVHSWEYWQFELNQAWPFIADSLGLAQGDRGADCSPVGEIAKATASGVIGHCLNNEFDVAGGKQEDFAAGTAYWKPDLGAFTLFGAINARYAEVGGPNSWLGFPKTNEQVTPDGIGRYVHFEHGSIYWSPETGAWAIPGDMVAAWGKDGFENGPLGYPTGPVKQVGEGYQQEFAGGLLTRNPDKSNTVVFGAIGAKYRELGGAASKLGFPTTGEMKINGGAFQKFDKGNIYWSPKTGAHMVEYGDIFNAWGNHGWEQGKFGWPTADFAEIPAGGLVQEFEHGEISKVFGNIREDLR
ncbi:hypothetical protein CPHO_11445 [Corynebacterium phocae]|uniref:Trehalose O-mycolyltransferase n=1 Tax=Corynebacterium phocae TaxID=161895 RepID=A0A1L7D5I0_9CORY|nr:alpha/beta hydrolase-fold protein [Corynebacterium phocae]APT93399.1 hypothetical protein CPHO_11445 [Corynebacterium phocae]KAA8721741.1 hypothetical protein F4V58_10920 [Corynebacterium phocae]